MPNIQHIAKLLTKHLRTRFSNAPNSAVIQGLLETLFYASLKTDEGRTISCTIIFVGAGVDLSPEYESLRRLHRYVYVPLATPIPLTARGLAKFSQAAAPWASSIAVRQMNDSLEICGLFDQEIHYQSALNREGEPRFHRPGLFQVEISKTGAMTFYDGRKLLAKLSHENLVTAFHDVLNEGPIAASLTRYIDLLEGRVKTQLRRIFSRKDVTPFLVEAPNLWLQTLSRILLGIRRLNHGGAVLLIPSKPTKDLSSNFAISYEQPEIVLERQLIAFARWQTARAKMRNEYSQSESLIPATLVQQRRNAFNEQEDARKAALGCTAFVSSLAGVDGLILLSRGLRVVGFGVEIKLRKDPTTAWRAGNALATPSKLKAISLAEFGTRHRSMMRYCDRHPGSIGFVISQDGDIRAMFKTQRGLVVWDNIQLQEVDTEDPSPTEQQQPSIILRRRKIIEERLRRATIFFQGTANRGRIKRRAWLSLSGDPLKVEIEIKRADSSHESQFFFDQRGELMLAIIRNEVRLNKEDIDVQETTRFFESWQLIRATCKTVRYKRRDKVSLSKVKAKLLPLPTPGDPGEGPYPFLEECNQTMGLIVANKKPMRRPSVAIGDSDRFSIIQGTSSSDGRLALGFGLMQQESRWNGAEVSIDETLGRKHYYVDAPELDASIRNYVVDLTTNQILGETLCRYVGTRRHYGHRTCDVLWSANNRFLIQSHQGKWGTVEASVACIQDNLFIAADLMKSVTEYAFKFLSLKKERAIRRFGADRFSETLRCTEISDTGIVRFEFFGQIPKSAEDDSTFSVIGRFRIKNDSQRIWLRMLEQRLGPRLSWAY